MKNLFLLSLVLCAAQGEAPITTIGGSDGPPAPPVPPADLKPTADTKPAEEAKALAAAWKGKSYDEAAGHHQKLLEANKHEDASKFHVAVIMTWKNK